MRLSQKNIKMNENCINLFFTSFSASNYFDQNKLQNARAAHLSAGCAFQNIDEHCSLNHLDQQLKKYGSMIR